MTDLRELYTTIINQQVAEIAAQKAEIEKLREALTNICWTTIAPQAHKIAQAALGETK